MQLDGGGALSTCTGGFTVRHFNGEMGISTAAHCRNTQSAQGRTLIFGAEDQEGNQDVQWHSACGLLDVSDDFVSGLDVRDVSGTSHRNNQPIGARVFKSGMISGYNHGIIISRSYAPSYVTNAASTFVRVRVDQDSVMPLVRPGDSGGPWYVGNTAYGITSGAPAGHSEDEAIYMPINYINSLGLSVLTSDPPGPACNTCSPTLCGSGRPPCCAGACLPSGLGGLMTCQE